MTATIFTTHTTADLFATTPIIYYYKDGSHIATRRAGVLTLEPKRAEAMDPLTRAKGFHYWKKHFPTRACYTLPAALQAAIDEPSRSWGTFINKNGKLVGYEG